MQRIPVWDIFVRASHWTVAVLVVGELSFIDDDSALHRWAGYTVLGVVALRLIWGLIGPRHARFSAFPPSLKAARAHLAGLLRGSHDSQLSHNPLGALMVYNLWASLIAVCATGILMTTRAFWGVEWVEEVHETLANWIMLSVLAHIGGVIFESRRSQVNLVRAMITGKKEFPNPRD